MPIKTLEAKHVEVDGDDTKCEGCVYLYEDCAYNHEPVDGCWYPEEE